MSAQVLIYYYRLTNHLWPFGLAFLFTNLCSVLQKNRGVLAWHGVDLHSNERRKVRLFQNGECVDKNFSEMFIPCLEYDSLGRQGGGQGKNSCIYLI